MKGKFVLYKWDNNVYEVMGERDGFITIKDVKFGYMVKTEIEQIILINNM